MSYRYRIRDWNDIFENSASRKLKRLDWISMPNKTDGEGYTALVDHPNAAAHLGAWLAIVEAASKQKPRGDLPNGIGSYVGGISQRLGRISQSLGRMSRLPAKVFEEVLPRLLEIGWIEEYSEVQTQENQQTVRDLLAESADALADSANTLAEVGGTGKGITGNYREENNTNKSRAPIAADLNGQTSPRFDEWWAIWSAVRGTNHRTQAQHAWVSVVPIELDAQCLDCTRSYLLAMNDPAKGYNPENFLFEQARDQFAARWPARNALQAARRLTPLEELQQEARNAKRQA